MVIFIIQPDRDVFQYSVLESYFFISSMYTNVETNIIFVPGETYEIIEYMMNNDLTKKFNIYK